VPFFALRLIQMQVERDVERNACRGGDGGGEADFGQAGVRLNAHAIGKRQVQNLAAGRAETPDDRQVNRAIGRLQNQSAVHHVFDGAGHAGAGDVQHVADIRYLDAHISAL